MSEFMWIAPAILGGGAIIWAATIFMAGRDDGKQPEHRSTRSPTGDVQKTSEPRRTIESEAA